jgi:hypothetical protein
MIGVAIHSSERDAAAEFFELFKTPWEFCRKGRRYDVLIRTIDQVHDPAPGLVLFYSAETTAVDSERRMPAKSREGGAMLSYEGKRFPIYGNVATFPGSQFPELRDEETQEPAAFISHSGDGTTLRVGYDLFQEVRLLLTSGQPPTYAGIPALELHIALLRDVITRSGIPLVEIPPVPEGYGFIACLTHDVDHPVLRNHCCDRTMFGFLYRATVGSLIHACCGRRSLRDLRRNLAAVARLPFVYLGAARDPWLGFDDYLELEAGLGATYFVIPRKGYAGRQASGSAPAARAARYTVDEIGPQLEKVRSAGCEVALHGLDAWLDSTSGRQEQQQLFRARDTVQVGVRMHWLYFDEHSASVLDQAGFSYDSSFGYNETVGYRAGTIQAYKPLGAADLMELPLHIMDTALFYPDYLNLSDREAERMVWKLIDDAAKFGGVLTVNWHDRSLAPERLWDRFYVKLINELKARGAWLPTAAQAVSWFRKRRSIRIDVMSQENGTSRIKVSVKPDDQLPGFRIRVHRPRAQNLYERISAEATTEFMDVPFKEDAETVMAPEERPRTRSLSESESQQNYELR